MQCWPGTQLRTSPATPARKELPWCSPQQAHLHVQQGCRPGQHVAAKGAGGGQHMAELAPAAARGARAKGCGQGPPLKPGNKPAHRTAPAAQPSDCTHLLPTAASKAAVGSARLCARQASSAASTPATPSALLAASATRPAPEPATSTVTGPPSCLAAVSVRSVLGCSAPSLCSARTSVLGCRAREGAAGGWRRQCGRWPSSAAWGPARA